MGSTNSPERERRNEGNLRRKLKNARSAAEQYASGGQDMSFEAVMEGQGREAVRELRLQFVTNGHPSGAAYVKRSASPSATLNSDEECRIPRSSYLITFITFAKEPP
jgi:hypothetical protein